MTLEQDCTPKDSVRDQLIAYSLLPFLTPSRWRLILEYFEEPERVRLASTKALAALLSISEEHARIVRNPLQLPEIERALDSIDRASVLTYIDPEYPSLLREIIDPPPALFLRGHRELLSTPAIAVVGSRRASPYGINAAARVARDLALAGVTVVSGLARGIDSRAHESALEAGGNTVAVLGNGIDVVYPSSHKKLFDRIAEEGLILTEFGPGTSPRPMNFPIRNRVISGLSRGTVIVEATSRSGSLITARLAAEQGREVFAVPGPIFSPGSEGTHRLIQYGAKLVHDVDDIFAELPDLVPPGDRRAPAHDSSYGVLQPLLDRIPYDDAIHVDALAAAMAQAVETLAEPLLQLELKGAVRLMPGSRYVRNV